MELLQKDKTVSNVDKGIEKRKIYSLHIITPLLLLLFSLNATDSRAQACCSGGVPIGGALGLGTAEKASTQFLLTYDHNVLRDLMDFTTLLDDDTRSRFTRSALLEVNYGIHERFALTAVLPFIRQERFIRGYNGQTEFTTTQGLGDMIFLLKYRITNSEKTPHVNWLIGAGPKIPTGRTDLRNNQGLMMVADMQPGSGSVDGIFWTFFQKSKFILDQMSLLSIVTFRNSGKNRSYNSSQVYQFGDEFQANLGLNYNFLLKWPLDLFLFGRYRSQTVDLIDGNTFPGSGGQWIYAIPGINLSFTPDISTRIWADWPVYRSLFGAQLTTTYKFSLSLFFNLSRKNEQPIFNMKFDE